MTIVVSSGKVMVAFNGICFFFLAQIGSAVPEEREEVVCQRTAETSDEVIPWSCRTDRAAFSVATNDNVSEVEAVGGTRCRIVDDFLASERC